MTVSFTVEDEQALDALWSAPALPVSLTLYGWSEQAVDLCWDACPGPGYRMVYGELEITLCEHHIRHYTSLPGMVPSVRLWRRAG